MAMSIVLKPAGAIVALISFGTVLYFSTRRATESSNPTTVATSAPDTNIAGWVVSDKGRTVQQTQLGLPQREFPVEGSGAALPAREGKYDLTVRGITLGTASPFPKYGIRFHTTGQLNAVDAWIDPRTRVLATCGAGILWQNSPLPEGFDMTRDHVIHSEWKDNGLAWKFWVDDDKGSIQERKFSKSSPAHHVTLVVEDAAATFKITQ